MKIEIKGESVIDKETADIIAQALVVGDITDMDADELGKLSIIYYENDPDVEFVALEYTSEAGDLHGENTEEEMMYTLGDE